MLKAILISLIATLHLGSVRVSAVGTATDSFADDAEVRLDLEPESEMSLEDIDRELENPLTSL